MDTRTPKEIELGIEVVKREKTVCYREIVALRIKERIPEAIAYIQQQIHSGKVTGTVEVVMNQGGVRQVVTEQVGRVKIGSELDELTDEVYSLKEKLDLQFDTA